jgi:hypothetical protein
MSAPTFHVYLFGFGPLADMLPSNIPSLAEVDAEVRAVLAKSRISHQFLGIRHLE